MADITVTARDLTSQALHDRIEARSRKSQSVPYPVTVYDEQGQPCGMLYPDGTYASCPLTNVGQDLYDADEGQWLEVVWDGASKLLLMW